MKDPPARIRRATFETGGQQMVDLARAGLGSSVADVNTGRVLQRNQDDIVQQFNTIVETLRKGDTLTLAQTEAFTRVTNDQIILLRERLPDGDKNAAKLLEGMKKEIASLTKDTSGLRESGRVSVLAGADLRPGDTAGSLGRAGMPVAGANMRVVDFGAADDGTGGTGGLGGGRVVRELAGSSWSENLRLSLKEAVAPFGAIFSRESITPRAGGQLEERLRERQREADAARFGSHALRNVGKQSGVPGLLKLRVDPGLERIANLLQGGINVNVTDTNLNTTVTGAAAGAAGRAGNPGTPEEGGG